MGTAINEALTGALFGRVWSLGYASYGQNYMYFAGGTNLPTSRSRVYHCRVRFPYSGTPSNFTPIFSISSIGAAVASPPLRVDLSHSNTGNIVCSINLFNGLNVTTSNNAVGVFNPTAGTAYDIALVWDGTGAASSVKVFVNGSVFGSLSPIGARQWNSPVEINMHTAINLGIGGTIVNSQIRFEEFAINDDATTSLAAFTGSSRTTDLIALAQYSGITWPTESQVLDAITWNEYGTEKTGNVQLPLVSDVSVGGFFGANGDIEGDLILPGDNEVLAGVSFGSQGMTTGRILLPPENKVLFAEGFGDFTPDGYQYTGNVYLPLAENVQSGIDFGADSNEFTGTLVSTDPGSSNVAEGIEYTIENVNHVGSFEFPQSTDPGVENVFDGTEYMINDVALIGTLDTNGVYANLRQFLNSILREIGCESLTDDEYATIDLPDDFVYTVDTFNALDAVLISRGDINSDRQKLEYYFLARGLELTPPVTDPEIKSQILMGIDLDDSPVTPTGKSNVFIGGTL